jgi:Zn-dependent protease/CBS domain-containing protein
MVAPPDGASPRRISLGRVVGIPVAVGPTWFIVAGVITIGFAPFVRQEVGDLGPGTYVVSFAFAVLLYASVLLHELSHALVARRLGLPVRGITLHFLGGYTEIERASPTPRTDLLVSAAGPAVSLLVAVAAWAASTSVDALVPGFLLWQLAVANALVGVFNLLPALPLDGGHILRAALWRVTGDEGRATSVAARAGQVLALLVVAAPFVTSGGRPSTLAMVWSVLIALLLWNGATSALRTVRLRSRLPAVSAHALARRAVPVPAELPLAEALRRARDAGARALVVVDGADRPVALVSEAAVTATPDERRPWVPVGQLARAIDDGMVLPFRLTGADLVRALAEKPATEYLVLDDAGRVYGVLTTGDVEAALQRA